MTVWAAGSTCCCQSSFFNFCFTWACCPLPKATCCDDGAHCCPTELPVCNTEAGRCTKKDSWVSTSPPPHSLLIRWSMTHTAAHSLFREQDMTCTLLRRSLWVPNIEAGQTYKDSWCVHASFHSLSRLPFIRSEAGLVI